MSNIWKRDYLWGIKTGTDGQIEVFKIFVGEDEDEDGNE